MIFVPHLTSFLHQNKNKNDFERLKDIGHLEFIVALVVGAPDLFVWWGSPVTVRCIVTCIIIFSFLVFSLSVTLA